MAVVKRSSLFPPDPHHIPGKTDPSPPNGTSPTYSRCEDPTAPQLADSPAINGLDFDENGDGYIYEGFVPQYGYQFGETFGKTTFRLLTDPNVRKSPRSLLAPLQKLRFIEDFSGTKHEVPDYIPAHPGDFSSTKATAGANLPDPALEPSAAASRRGPAEERPMPARTGPGDAAPLREQTKHVPSHPGLRLAYAYEQRISPQSSTTPKASEEKEGRLPDITVASGREEKDGPCQPDSACGQGWTSFPCVPEIKRPGKTVGATLPAVAEPVDAESYNRFPRLDVPNAIQQKVISGYTGYIPRYTWITGVTYLQGVKDAMNEFDRNQLLLRNPVCEFGKRLPQTYWPNNRIYTSVGLIPFYTGFVPTLRNSYALTFGNSTRKAYQKEQRRQACALRKKL